MSVGEIYKQGSTKSYVCVNVVGVVLPYLTHLHTIQQNESDTRDTSSYILYSNDIHIEKFLI